MSVRSPRKPRARRVLSVPPPPVIRWYVLAIKAGQHKKIIEKLDDLGVEVFYPERVVWRKQRVGPRKPHAYPLIACYVFVGCDLSRISARSILSINGIVNFLGVEGVPSECDPDELARMRDDVAAGLYDETLARMQKLIVGHNVLIDEGPFQGFSGPIVSVHNDIVAIDINVLGKTTTIKIHVDKLAH